VANLADVAWRDHQKEIYSSVWKCSGYGDDDQGAIRKMVGPDWRVDRPLVVVGGVGVFKTSTLIVSLFSFWRTVAELYHHPVYMVFAQTYKQLNDAFIQQWIENVPPSAYVYNEQRSEIKLVNTSLKIWLRHSGHFEGGASAALASNKARGPSICGFMCPQAESVSREFIDEIRRRTRLNPTPKYKGMYLPYRLRVLDANPDSPEHWLYRRYIDRDSDDYIGDSATVFEIPTTPQTSVYTETEIEEARRTMPEYEFERMYRCKWVQKSGAVYRDYTVLEHAPDPSHIQEIWVGMDPGTANPDREGNGNMGLVVIGFMQDGTYCIMQEKLHVWNGLEDVHSVIQGMIDRWGGVGKLRYVIRDWGGGSGTPIVDYLRQVGLTQIAYPHARRAASPWYAVEAGVEIVRDAFRESKLVISPECKGILRDLQLYSYGDGDSDRPDKRVYDAHRLDALRYAWIRIHRYNHGG
jgi:hypothetical protein